jgi:hypothetical protein
MGNDTNAPRPWRESLLSETILLEQGLNASRSGHEDPHAMLDTHEVPGPSDKGHIEWTIEIYQRSPGHGGTMFSE